MRIDPRPLAAAGDPQHGAEVDPLEPPVRRRDQLGGRLDVVDRRSRRPRSVCPARSATSRSWAKLDEAAIADEQQRHPDVHEVAAVAAPVAPHERDERDAARGSRAITRRARTPRTSSCADAADHEAGEREHDQRVRLAARARAPAPRRAPRPPPRRHEQFGAGSRAVARRQAISGPIPDSSTSTSASGTVQPVEHRRPERVPAAGERLGDQREEGAPPDHDGTSARARGC